MNILGCILRVKLEANSKIKIYAQTKETGDNRIVQACWGLLYYMAERLQRNSYPTTNLGRCLPLGCCVH